MNPSQKAGNPRYRKKYSRKNAKDYRMKRIARQEAKKVVLGTIESKTYDEFESAKVAIDSATGVLRSLVAGMVRGFDDGELTGDQIQPTHLRCRMGIIGNDSTNFVRVILFQYKQAGGTPALNTLLAGSDGFRYLSPYATNYNEIYNVLFDEVYTTCGNGTASSCAENSAIIVDMRIPGSKLKKIQFTSTGAVASGDIYLVLCTDSSATGHPTFSYASRLYYKDA